MVVGAKPEGNILMNIYDCVSDVDAGPTLTSTSRCPCRG